MTGDPYLVKTNHYAMSTHVHFFKENIRLRLMHRDDLCTWVGKAIRKEGFKPGTVNVVFCSDPYLRKMNRHYLQHDYFTDIITFDLTEDPSVINGDLFISVDRVKANALEYGTGFRDELHRVIIHGVLHLCGYSDKSPLKSKEMRKREDHYLARRTWC